MQFNLDTANSKYPIRSYQPGQIKINDEIITQSIIVTPRQLINPWRPQNLAELTAADVNCLLELNPPPMIVLLGTGATLKFPPTALLAALYEKQIGVEIMDTGAACRTFMVLSSEGRNVAAALLII